MLEKRIKSSLEEWNVFSYEIEKALEKQNFSMDFITSVILASDEIFANKVMHTYKDGEGIVIIKLTTQVNENEKLLKLSFSDYGQPFNPVENITAPDTNKTIAKSIKSGGLGLFIAKSQVDELLYEYTDNMNILTLLKRESV